MLDCGGHGPIFSTIHASKGREADRVFLMLPRNLDYLETDGGKNIDADEEARVFYVGSTRMRKELRRGTALTMVGAKAMVPGSRRVVHMLGSKPPKVQLCMEDDIAEEAPVTRGTEYCAGPQAASAAQRRLVELWTEALASGGGLEVQALLATVSGEATYKFLCKGSVIAWADTALMRDLRRIAEIRQRRLSWSSLKPPANLKPLRLIGLRTVAIPEGPVHEGRLHEPFATSGFLLAPIICGFPVAFIEFDKQP
jgi:superfamily I DNA/RNA helicase